MNFAFLTITPYIIAIGMMFRGKFMTLMREIVTNAVCASKTLVLSIITYVAKSPRATWKGRFKKTMDKMHQISIFFVVVVFTRRGLLKNAMKVTAPRIWFRRRYFNSSSRNSMSFFSKWCSQAYSFKTLIPLNTWFISFSRSSLTIICFFCLCLHNNSNVTADVMMHDCSFNQSKCVCTWFFWIRLAMNREFIGRIITRNPKPVRQEGPMICHWK